ncbi:hypothetical protein ASC85_01575 [Pseudomonas sp. Root401]|nr:hypothetical protein ASC85_01575 [Pseudomonas sp. Root401]
MMSQRIEPGHRDETEATEKAVARERAVECNEAAIFPQTLESQAKDQKIAGFASSYRAEREQSLATGPSFFLRRTA